MPNPSRVFRSIRLLHPFLSRCEFNLPLLFGPRFTRNRFRNSYLSTTLMNAVFGRSTERPSPLTSRIAMRHSLPSSSSTRCVSGDITPSHPLSTTCPMTSFGKTGSCRTACSAIYQVLSTVTSRLAIAIAILAPLRKHSSSFNLRQSTQAMLHQADAWWR